MTTQTEDIIDYYAGLLILQYLGKRKASGMIAAVVGPVLMGDSNEQTLSFSSTVSSGTFKLVYDSVATAALSWSASAGTIQTALQAILPSPVTVVVTGTIADGLLFTFSDNVDPVEILSVSDSTLNGSPVAVFNSVGDQLPMDVQNAFNLIGPDYAIGDQLDVLGKYVGASRSGYGLNGPITLSDADFLTLIQIAIIRNNAGSSLAAIQAYINQFFAGIIYVFDYQNMNMSYLIDTSIGDQDLVSLLIAEDLLPRPMGVGLAVIAVPVIDKFFAFRTYSFPAWVNTTPFQTYAAYDTTWLWLSYQDAVIV